MIHMPFETKRSPRIWKQEVGFRLPDSNELPHLIRRKKEISIYPKKVGFRLPDSNELYWYKSSNTDGEQVGLDAIGANEWSVGVSWEDSLRKNSMPDTCVKSRTSSLGNFGILKERFLCSHTLCVMTSERCFIFFFVNFRSPKFFEGYGGHFVAA